MVKYSNDTCIVDYLAQSAFDNHIFLVYQYHDRWVTVEHNEAEEPHTIIRYWDTENDMVDQINWTLGMMKAINEPRLLIKVKKKYGIID